MCVYVCTVPALPCGPQVKTPAKTYARTSSTAAPPPTTGECTSTCRQLPLRLCSLAESCVIRHAKWYLSRLCFHVVCDVVVCTHALCRVSVMPCTSVLCNVCVGIGSLCVHLCDANSHYSLCEEEHGTEIWSRWNRGKLFLLFLLLFFLVFLFFFILVIIIFGQ